MKTVFLLGLGLLASSVFANNSDTTTSRSVTGTGQAAGANVSINQIDTSAYPKVTIFATVMKDQVPLKGLGAGDFRVREDEVDQEPITVVPKLTPLSAVLALDTSGSMKKRLPEAQAAAKSFIDSLSPEDKVQVIAFARAVKPLSMEGNREAAKAAISNTVARGDTALYDALYASVDSLRNKAGRKAVTVLSDGADDNGSGKPLSKHSLDQVLTEAQEVNVPIFALGVGTEIDEPTLKRLAESTGGIFLLAPQPSELKALYARISEQLAGQYNIFYTSNLPSDGSEHQVQLKYGDSTGTKGFKAPLAMAQISKVAAADTPAPAPAAKPVNLLAADNGGHVVLTPNASWARTIDGKEDQLYWYNVGDEAVYGFKGDQPATFDTFSMLIPDANKNNVKEFELLSGDSPTGEFKSIGKFTTQNLRMMRGGGYQEFKFAPVTAKYLKVKLLAAHGGKDTRMVLYEFRLLGQPSSQAAATPAPAPKGVNLLSAANGGQVIAAPNESWARTIDGNEDQLYWYNAGDEAVYGFKDDQPATFHTFSMLIPDTNPSNVKSFELLVADDSPTGNFKSIGKFDTVNARVGNTGYQDFTFAPVTAKYLKVKLLAAHGKEGTRMVLYEFRLFGEPKK
jgi:VWFA-related protein